jgi:hypothetical protein
MKRAVSVLKPGTPGTSKPDSDTVQLTEALTWPAGRAAREILKAQAGRPACSPGRRPATPP